MKLEIRQIVEVLGVTGVIASLLFVGVQLNLDRQVALGSAYQQRADSRKEDLRMQFESESWIADEMDRFNQGARPAWWNDDIATMQAESGQSIESFYRNSLRTQINIYQFDNLVYQWELGLVDDPIVNSVLLQWQNALDNDNPIVRGVLSMGFVRPETYEMLESNRSQ